MFEGKHYLSPLLLQRRDNTDRRPTSPAPGSNGAVEWYAALTPDARRCGALVTDIRSPIIDLNPGGL